MKLSPREAMITLMWVAHEANYDVEVMFEQFDELVASVRGDDYEYFQKCMNNYEGFPDLDEDGYDDELFELAGKCQLNMEEYYDEDEEEENEYYLNADEYIQNMFEDLIGE